LDIHVFHGKVQFSGGGKERVGHCGELCCRMEMPFGMLSRVGPRNRVLDGDPDLPMGGAILRGRACPKGHVPTCPYARRQSDVSCAKTAETIEMPYGVWTRVDLQRAYLVLAYRNSTIYTNLRPLHCSADGQQTVQ